MSDIKHALNILKSDLTMINDLGLAFLAAPISFKLIDIIDNIVEFKTPIEDIYECCYLLNKFAYDSININNNIQINDIIKDKSYIEARNILQESIKSHLKRINND